MPLPPQSPGSVAGDAGKRLDGDFGQCIDRCHVVPAAFGNEAPGVEVVVRLRVDRDGGIFGLHLVAQLADVDHVRVLGECLVPAHARHGRGPALPRSFPARVSAGKAEVSRHLAWPHERDGMLVDGAQFDLQSLFLAVDAQRVALELSWAALGRLVGVDPSTIRRFGTADDAEADGVLALVRWLEVPPEDFVSGGLEGGERLAPPGMGMVRVDMDAVRELDSSVSAGRSRTTIRRLVAVATEAGRTVASLTRVTTA